jgi:hypothetical protein
VEIGFLPHAEPAHVSKPIEAQDSDDRAMRIHAVHDRLSVQLSQRTNLSAGPLLVTPKFEQLIDLLDRKAERASERA